MMKKIISFILIVLMTASMVVSAGFSDVKSSSQYYDAIVSLSEKGVITGFEDGSFRPNDSVTRAQMAAMIIRAADLQTSYEQSIYNDVRNDHWARGYIMAATNAGIINGMGNGIFDPEGKVTYSQAIKMVVCMIGEESAAASNGGWPNGYTSVAYSKGIIDSDLRYEIMYGSKGSEAADRKNVALIIYNAVSAMNANKLTVGGKALSLGMSASSLDTPDEKIASTAGFTWYVYGTDTYNNFYTLGVDDNKVVAIAATGNGFVYNGIRCGDVISSVTQKNIYTDSNDSNKVHSVLLMNDSYPKNSRYGIPDREKMDGESKMNFHFTNAFRVSHGKKILSWHSGAAEVAKLHSEDMATNNYFSHEGLNGSNPGTRLDAQGIRWMGYGENIAAGTVRYLGFHSFDGWVNSAGHRQNMLSDNKSLGVGMAYSASSQYSYYHTQVFVTAR